MKDEGKVSRSELTRGRHSIATASFDWRLAAGLSSIATNPGQ